MNGVPKYPFFRVDKSEVAFGAQLDRYLAVHKERAREICALLPQETAMADMLFARGHLGEEQFGMAGRECAIEASPEDIRDTTAALMRSWGPSHEVKIATIAVALHRWFPKSEQPA